MGSVLTPTVRLFYLVVRARFLHLEVIHHVPILPLLKLSRMQDRPLLFMGRCWPACRLEPWGALS